MLAPRRPLRQRFDATFGKSSSHSQASSSPSQTTSRSCDRKRSQLPDSLGSTSHARHWVGLGRWDVPLAGSSSVTRFSLSSVDVSLRLATIRAMTQLEVLTLGDAGLTDLAFTSVLSLVEQVIVRQNQITDGRGRWGMGWLTTCGAPTPGPCQRRL